MNVIDYIKNGTAIMYPSYIERIDCDNYRGHHYQRISNFQRRGLFRIINFNLNAKPRFLTEINDIKENDKNYTNTDKDIDKSNRDNNKDNKDGNKDDGKDNKIMLNNVIYTRYKVANRYSTIDNKDFSFFLTILHLNLEIMFHHSSINWHQILEVHQ